MPTVTAKSTPVVICTPVANVTLPQVITEAELVVAESVFTKYDVANAAKKAAEKEADAEFLKLAAKALGIQTADELKSMTPTQVSVRLTERMAKGLLKVEGKKDFEIVETGSQCRPAWKEAFIEKLGEVAANQVIADTETSHSYWLNIFEVVSAPKKAKKAA